MRQAWDQSAPFGGAGAGAAAWAEAPAAGQHLYGGRMTDTRRYEAVQVTQVNTTTYMVTNDTSGQNWLPDLRKANVRQCFGFNSIFN